MLPELSDMEARGVFICLLKRWQVSHPPATWTCCFSKISLENQEQEAFAGGRGGCRAPWGLHRAGVWGHLNLQELQPQHPTGMLLSSDMGWLGDGEAQLHPAFLQPWGKVQHHPSPGWEVTSPPQVFKHKL